MVAVDKRTRKRENTVALPSCRLACHLCVHTRVVAATAKPTSEDSRISTTHTYIHTGR